MRTGQEQFNIDALDAPHECEILVLFKGYNKDSGKCVALEDEHPGCFHCSFESAVHDLDDMVCIKLVRSLFNLALSSSGVEC